MGETSQVDAAAFNAICREAVACNHCFKQRFAARSFVDIAQPRYIGPSYWKARQRWLFLFINPGAGSASVEDREMRKELHTFRDGRLDLDELFAYQRSYMAGWGRNGRFQTYFSEIGVSLDNIALLNIAWCGSAGNNYPDSMLGACWSRFTRRTLSILAPTQIFACGVKAQKFAQRAQIDFAKLPHFAARGSIDYGAIRRTIFNDGAAPNVPVTLLGGSQTSKTTARRTVIRLLRLANPKSGKSALRYNCYRDEMTVAEYEATVAARHGRAEAVKCRADIEWDLERGFIRLEEQS